MGSAVCYVICSRNSELHVSLCYVIRLPLNCLCQTAVFYVPCWVVAIIYGLRSGLGDDASTRRALRALASSFASEICVSADCSRMNSRLFAYLNGVSQIEEMCGVKRKVLGWGGFRAGTQFSETVLSHRNGCEGQTVGGTPGTTSALSCTTLPPEVRDHHRGVRDRGGHQGPSVPSAKRGPWRKGSKAEGAKALPQLAVSNRRGQRPLRTKQALQIR